MTASQSQTSSGPSLAFQQDYAIELSVGFKVVEVSHKVGKEKDKETLQGKEYDGDYVQAVPVTLCVFRWEG